MGFGCLPWVGWDYAHRWLPESVHISPFAKDAICYYMEDWVQACTHGGRPLTQKHLHHFLLTAGLLIRDVNSAYFSLADPDDVDLLPEHVRSTQLGLDFAVQVEGVVAQVEQFFMQSSSPQPAKTHTTKKRGSGSQSKKRLQSASPATKGGDEVGSVPGSSSKKRRADTEATGSVPGSSSKKRRADTEATGIDEPRRKRVKGARPNESLGGSKPGVSKDPIVAVESRQSSRLQDKGPRVKYLKNGGMIRPGQ